MSASVRRSSPVVATPRSYVRRSTDDDRVQAGLGRVAELLVQRAHGDIAVFAGGHEAAKPGPLRSGDLRPFQRRSHSSPAPRAPNGRQTVARFAAEIVERGVADRLVAGERDEEVLRSPRGALD